MMKRIVIGAVAIIATAGISVLQSACGDRSSEAPPAEQAAPPATTEAPAPAPEPAPAPQEQASAPAAQAPQAPAPRPAPRPQNPAPAPAAAAPAPAPPPPPPPPPPRQFTFRQGMPITVFTTSTLSTKANKTGETFSAVLAKPIASDDWVIAKQGARVEGVIIDSDPGGRVKGVASMTLGLRRLTLADGRTIELDTNTVIAEAKSTKGKDAKRVGIGAGVGAAIGAIAGGGSGAAIGAAVGGGAGTAAALSTRGDAVEFAAESELNFTLSSPITITEQK